MKAHSLAVVVVCQLVRLYQAIAPSVIRKVCRFEPTCSDYALQVFKRDGFLRGCPKVLARLCRCCPPNGGSDPP